MNNINCENCRGNQSINCSNCLNLYSKNCINSMVENLIKNKNSKKGKKKLLEIFNNPNLKIISDELEKYDININNIND